MLTGRHLDQVAIDFPKQLVVSARKKVFIRRGKVITRDAIEVNRVGNPMAAEAADTLVIGDRVRNTAVFAARGKLTGK